MKTTLVPVSMLAWLVIQLPVCGEEAKPVAPEWFKTMPGDTFVRELVLKPGETKAIEIKGTNRIVVGFQTNIRLGQTKGVPDDAIVVHGGKEPLNLRWGGMGDFMPRDGKCDIKVENKAKIEMRVAIFTRRYSRPFGPFP